MLEPAEEYRHGIVGARVGRLLPSPERVCPHSWSSVVVTLFDNRLWFVERKPDDTIRLFRYQRLLVAVLREQLKGSASVHGWNGMRQRIYVRVYRGCGSRADHTRYRRVERTVHRLVELPLRSLNALLKKKLQELP